MITFKKSLEEQTGFKLSNLVQGTQSKNGNHSTIANIKWFKLKITDEELLNNHSYVNLLFFKIEESEIKEAIKNNAIFKKNEKVNGLSKHKIINGIDYKMSSYKYAHIDGDSGNIHPGESIVGSFKLDKIRQIVLCSKINGDAGPKCTCNDYNDKESYIFDDFHIHKACFYPLINNEDEDVLKNDKRYLYLKNIWDTIPSEFKEEI